MTLVVRDPAVRGMFGHHSIHINLGRWLCHDEASMINIKLHACRRDRTASFVSEMMRLRLREKAEKS